MLFDNKTDVFLFLVLKKVSTNVMVTVTRTTTDKWRGST